MLKAGLNVSSIDRLLAASRKLVAHFHHSVVATEALKEKQQQMNVKGKKLVTACQTHWNSSFQMLDHLLKLKWPVIAVLSDENVTKRSDCSLDLRSEQWSLAEELVKILEPFNIATTFLSYEENVSASSILHVLYGLLDNLKGLESDDETDSVAICQFKEAVKHIPN